MSSPTNSTQQGPQQSSQETFFLLPEVYSEADPGRSRTEDVTAKELSDRNNSPSELQRSPKQATQSGRESRSAEEYPGIQDASSKSEEPLTGNTLDALEAELAKTPVGPHQNPTGKADSLLDDAEDEFEAQLAKAMVRRSEYYPASSDESDAAQRNRKKKASAPRKEPGQSSPIQFRIEALETMMAELMDSSDASVSIHGEEEQKMAAPVSLDPAAMVPPAAATKDAPEISSPTVKKTEISLPSPIKQKRKAPSTPPTLSTVQADQSTTKESSTNQTKFNLIPNLNPMAWLQRHDSPQEEMRHHRLSGSITRNNIPVEAALISLVPDTQHVAPGHPVRVPQHSPPTSAPNNTQTPPQPPVMPAWASPGYNGPLPERIKICSPYLLAVFEQFVRGKEDWISDGGLVLCRPYRPLIRHEGVIRQLQERLSHDLLQKTSRGISQRAEAVFTDPSEGSPTMKTLLDLPNFPIDNDALFDTQLLVNFIDHCLKPHIARVTSEEFMEIGFADLWYLFNPGGLVISTNEDQAYRVIEVVYPANTSRKIASTTAFGVKCVHMDYDGSRIGPVINFFRIEKYFGRRDITSLPIYPLRCNEDPSGLQKILVDRGRKFMRAVLSKHMYHMGTTLDSHEQVNGQVMIDFEQTIARNPHWKPDILAIGESLLDKMADEDCQTGNRELLDLSTGRELASEYLLKHGMTAPYLRSRRMAGEESSVGDDELMLLTSRVIGLILRTRKWATFRIDCIHRHSNTADSECFERLVLPQGHKAMLESLVRSHFRQKNGRMHRRKLSNPTRGDGPGLNILLHGAPGTGKTWTAECIAGAFDRPLLSISCGELGTSPNEMAKQLKEVFTLAQKWECVLLIDDADMLLVERTRDDFTRDSLVSAFLRALDQYSGILFLTTSRESAFDEAFHSRIQLSLHYPPPLDDKTNLEVWECGIWQARKRQRGLRIKEEDILQFAAELWDAGHRWTGRQVANAFRTATALAEAEALDDRDSNNNGNRLSVRWQDGKAGAQQQSSSTTLRRRHFEQVVHASVAFAQRRLPVSPPPPPTVTSVSPAESGSPRQQRVIDNYSVRDLKRSNSVAVVQRRERASTMPESRRPSQAPSSSSSPPSTALPALPEAAAGGGATGPPSRRPSVKTNRLTHRARSSVGTSLRQEIWPAARESSRESLVPVVPELPLPPKQQRESSAAGPAEMWDVDPDRHDFTMRIPYEQLRL